jgi:hypothetical protein
MTPPVLTNSVVYDIETFPNMFSLHWEFLDAPGSMTFEVSEFRDDRAMLFAWMHGLASNQTPMIGYNSIGFDYPVIHWLFRNPTATVSQIYDRAMQIIQSNDRFANTIWESDRLMPQVDLYKMCHFDNPAKRTSLKALQVNMRSPNVVESPVPFGTRLTQPEIADVISYNRHDVSETKRFAHFCMGALSFRAGMTAQFGMDVFNWPDTKIGSKILEQRLGKRFCYYYDANNKRQLRQTPRQRIALNEIIFPIVRFSNPEFQRILDYMRAQVLTPEDLTELDAPIQTKGVFAGLKAHVGGVDFHFGTGGIHGSVRNKHIVAGNGWLIRDIDVASLYPSIAIVNRLAPEHMGAAFVAEYTKLPEERRLHPKGSVENGAFKLASNGTYGNSNNKYSPFFDPKFTMQITVNGQLMLAMLVEWLTSVPTLQVLQANTDGITYHIHETHEPHAAAIVATWEMITGLTMESVDYSAMFLADVNTYLAIGTDGKVKQKGRLWYPDTVEAIGTASPPAWHKDLSNVASTKAAVSAMLNGGDPEAWLRSNTDPFDFMCRVKCDRASKLMLGDEQVQSMFRYYVARTGKTLVKISPPAGPEGAFKRAPRVTELEYNRVMAETGGEWDPRVCTANKSRYETRRIGIEADRLVAPCNDASDFDFDNLDWDWYIEEARKLMVG